MASLFYSSEGGLKCENSRSSAFPTISFDSWMYLHDPAFDDHDVNIRNLNNDFWCSMIDAESLDGQQQTRLSSLPGFSHLSPSTVDRPLCKSHESLFILLSPSTMRHRHTPPTG
jgi:hypothetical protein